MIRFAVCQPLAIMSLNGPRTALSRSMCRSSTSWPRLTPPRHISTLPDSAGNVKKADLLGMRAVERMNRLGGRLQQDRAALFRKILLSFRRQMHIAHLARAKN